MARHGVDYRWETLSKRKKNRKWDIQFGDNVLDVPHAWQLSHAAKEAVATGVATTTPPLDLTAFEMSSSSSPSAQPCLRDCVCAFNLIAS